MSVYEIALLTSVFLGTAWVLRTSVADFFETLATAAAILLFIAAIYAWSPV